MFLIFDLSTSTGNPEIIFLYGDEKKNIRVVLDSKLHGFLSDFEAMLRKSGRKQSDLLGIAVLYGERATFTLSRLATVYANTLASVLHIPVISQKNSDNSSKSWSHLLLSLKPFYQKKKKHSPDLIKPYYLSEPNISMPSLVKSYTHKQKP